MTAATRIKSPNKPAHPTAGNVLLRIQASIPAVDGLDVRQRFPADMTRIIHDPVHLADMRRNHSVHPERLGIDRPCDAQTFQDLEGLSGVLTGEPLGFTGGIVQRGVFDRRFAVADSIDVVVWFHGNSEEANKPWVSNRSLAFQFQINRFPVARCHHF